MFRILLVEVLAMWWKTKKAQNEILCKMIPADLRKLRRKISRLENGLFLGSAIVICALLAPQGLVGPWVCIPLFYGLMACCGQVIRTRERIDCSITRMASPGMICVPIGREGESGNAWHLQLGANKCLSLDELAVQAHLEWPGGWQIVCSPNLSVDSLEKSGENGVRVVQAVTVYSQESGYKPGGEVDDDGDDRERESGEAQTVADSDREGGPAGSVHGGDVSTDGCEAVGSCCKGSSCDGDSVPEESGCCAGDHGEQN